MNKPVLLHGDGQRDKFREELRRLQASLDSVLAAQSCLAKVTRAKYDALISEGFTPAQAVELCK